MQITNKINIGSQTDKKTSYLVQFYEDGSATCSCPFWKFKSHGDLFFQCKHIKKAIKYYEGKINKMS